MTKSGTTIAEDKQRLARALAAADAFERARDSDFEDDEQLFAWDFCTHKMITIGVPAAAFMAGLWVAFA